MKKVLVIAAHPDDEILGCGGTIAKLKDQGFEPHVIILGEGVTSRDPSRNINTRKKELENLENISREALNTLGIKNVYFGNFPDNRFDEIPQIQINKYLEELSIKIGEIDSIFTHFSDDLNVDHRMTFKSVLTAFRPLGNNKTPDIYSFYIPSSTEWSHMSFNPTTFVDIAPYIDKKIEALKLYKSEMRDYPHPRSLENVKNISKFWGSFVNLKYCEPFITIRNMPWSK